MWPAHSLGRLSGRLEHGGVVDGADAADTRKPNCAVVPPVFGVLGLGVRSGWKAASGCGGALLLQRRWTRGGGADGGCGLNCGGRQLD